MENNLSIYNTLTRKKELFIPIQPKYVGMYVCGPTVYSDVHLGNVRTFMNFDIVFRYLKFLGYKVRYVRNITDVGHLVNDIDSGEDKIGKKAKLENLEPMEIVQMYTNRFHDVMKLFNIESPNIEPTATGHILEQIEMVQRIIENGFAYEKNGSVYFDVLKYNQKNNYGKLSGRVVEDLLSNTRELDGQGEKNNPLDFAIWKAAEKNHIMRWNSPWGQGFPGWHLECSVMSTKYLSQEFDIHGGGMDLKFPHHECEIAQSIAADGKEPVKYWMHANMLTVNGRKMAKSEGNGFTPEELITGNHKLLEKGYSPMTVRFFMLQCHYASTLDFSNEALQAAEKGFQRLLSSFNSIAKIIPFEKSSVDVLSIEKRCFAAMNDDFNSPILISVLFDAAKIINNLVDKRETISAEDLKKLTSIINGFTNEVLGLREEESNKESTNNNLSTSLMETIIYLRNEAKKGKDFSTADKIRENLNKLNITLKDSPLGTEWELS
jgi:cysteinyl-tRNA synthetase